MGKYPLLSHAVALALLAGCARAPDGANPSMPNCVYRCYVAPTTVAENPELDTLTHTGGDVTSTTTKTEAN